MFGNHEDLLSTIDIQSIQDAIDELKEERSDLNIIHRTISITDGIIMLLEITGQGGSHMMESQLEYRYGYIAISNAAPGYNDQNEEVVIENMLEYDGDNQHQRDALFEYFKSTVLNQMYLIRRLYSGYNENTQQEETYDEQESTKKERKVAVSSARQNRNLPPLSYEQSSLPPLSTPKKSVEPLDTDNVESLEAEPLDTLEAEPLEEKPEELRNEDTLDDPFLHEDNNIQAHQVADVEDSFNEDTLQMDDQEEDLPEDKLYYPEDSAKSFMDDFDAFYAVDAENINGKSATNIDQKEDDDKQKESRNKRKPFKGMFT